MALKDKKQIIETLAKAKRALENVGVQTTSKQIAFIDQEISRMQKDLAVLEFAHQDCFDRLQAEIVKQKSGIDLSSLLDRS